jgi:hypothetical protein
MKDLMREDHNVKEQPRHIGEGNVLSITNKFKGIVTGGTGKFSNDSETHLD